MSIGSVDTTKIRAQQEATKSDGIAFFDANEQKKPEPNTPETKKKFDDFKIIKNVQEKSRE